MLDRWTLCMRWIVPLVLVGGAAQAIAETGPTPEPKLTRILYLKNMETQEAVTLLRSQAQVRQMAELRSLGLLVVKGVAERIDRCEALLRQREALVRSVEPHPPEEPYSDAMGPEENWVYSLRDIEPRAVVTLLRALYQIRFLTEHPDGESLTVRAPVAKLEASQALLETLGVLQSVEVVEPTRSRLELKLDERWQRLAAAQSDREKFYPLNDIARLSFELGDHDTAEQFAEKALAVAAEFPEDWNYGNAIHDGHMVLGRIALAGGDGEEAKRRLLLAGGTPGSPQLGSFGPNVSLARDLLDAGERETVLEYLRLCQSFWKSERRGLDGWIVTLEQGRRPDFGANLNY